MGSRSATRSRTPSLVAKHPSAGSVAEWLRFLGADSDPGWVPVWPPDAFAFTAALLRRTGAYVSLVNGFRSRAARRRQPEWREPGRVGEAWRSALEKILERPNQALKDACPQEIRQWWTELMSCGATPLSDCALSARIVEAATSLCIASDEASVGIGIGTTDEFGIQQSTDPFLAVADSVLRRNGYRSFCFHVPPSKLAVLGKQHTPQRGCTIRSLTHHLALYTPTEIQAFWWGPYESAEREPDVFNLLLLPWPTSVDANDFATTWRRSGRGADVPVPHHRYFEYRPRTRQTPAALARRVSRAIDGAAPYVDKVHGIVLPELSLSPAEYLAVERVAVRRGAILITGLRAKGSNETHGMPINACAFQPAGLTAIQKDAAKRSEIRHAMRQVQLKHHRWCLDRGQILQYNLGGRLPASRDCWERSYIGQRDVNFVTLTSWLTTCVLVCEDLARQDPVADVIRAVGPNLVFALLMDGPQLRGRWGSRYASVLAEDPGCSVLTITSLGMSRRSQPQDSGQANRFPTIALWRDAVYGEKEVALDDGHDAGVLSLVCKTRQEFTIDGRGDGQKAHFPVFAGFKSFVTPRRAMNL